MFAAKASQPLSTAAIVEASLLQDSKTNDGMNSFFLQDASPLVLHFLLPGRPPPVLTDLSSIPRNKVAQSLNPSSSIIRPIFH